MLHSAKAPGAVYNIFLDSLFINKLDKIFEKCFYKKKKKKRNVFLYICIKVMILPILTEVKNIC